MIDLTALAAALTTLRAQLAATGSLAGQTASGAQPLLQAITNAQATADSAYDAIDAVLATSTGTIAGVVSGDGAASAAAFTDYLGVAEQAPDVNDLSNYLGRMAINVQAATGNWPPSGGS